MVKDFFPCPYGLRREERHAYCKRARIHVWKVRAYVGAENCPDSQDLPPLQEPLLGHTKG